MTRKQHNKIKFFGRTIYEFCGEFKIKKPLVIKPDKRFVHITAEVVEVKEKKTGKKGYIIYYNPKGIGKLAYWKIVYTILHELGHVKTKQTGSEFDREYRAERFTYNMFKRHFKLQLPRYLKYINWYSSNYKDVYTKVFYKLWLELAKKGEV